ncbi:hypothetical protein BsWGS_19094 [Bradybaena similaris]
MEVSTEISQKIRSAIKAKLMELGAYVDDELPDYIMVMVANKRSRAQMNKDLGLFLGSHTSSFTEWLHSLLAKLQTIRSDFDNKSADKRAKGGKVKVKDKPKGDKQIDGLDSVAKQQENLHSADVSAENQNDVQSSSCDGNKYKHSGDARESGGSSSKPSIKSENNDIVRADLFTNTTPMDAVSEEETMDSEVVPVGVDTNSASASLSPDRGQSYSVNRKRKAPSSLADGSKESPSEVFHPYDNPAFDGISSELTADNSRSLQVRRAQLLQAVAEVEHTIAVKRKVSVTKTVCRDDSPSEQYSPKRKWSHDSLHEKTPPPYIPSSKHVTDQSSHNDCIPQSKETRSNSKSTPVHEDCRELISRYRREELLRSIGIVRDSSQQAEYRSHGRNKSCQKLGENFTSKRDVRAVSNSKNNQNSHLTTHLTSSDAQRTTSGCSHGQVEKHSSPGQSLHVYEGLACCKDTRTSAASRLGKLVRETKDSFGDENVVCAGNSRTHDDFLSNSKFGDDVNSIVGPETTNFIENRSRTSASIYPEQYGECFISPEATHTSRNKQRHYTNVNRDAFIDTCSQSKFVEGAGSSLGGVGVPVEYRYSQEAPAPPFMVQSSRVGESDQQVENGKVKDEDTQILSKNFSDNCMFDLGVCNTTREPEEGDVKERGNVERRQGVTFIVTLDGVDESQFGSENVEEVQSGCEIVQKGHFPFEKVSAGQCGKTGSLSETVKCPVVPAAVARVPVVVSDLKQLYQEQKLHLETAVARSESLMMFQQVQAMKWATVGPSLPPSKSHPTLISLQELGVSKNKVASVPTLGHHCSAEDMLVEKDGSSTHQVQKLERCKFWPACSAGASCGYYHPTTHCKMFPSCRFADKCLFIHPNCRFDSRCTRPDCPYTHSSRRQSACHNGAPIIIPKSHFMLPPVPRTPHNLGLTYSGSQPACRYFPNCENRDCPFLHPKLCRFGLACKNHSCSFFHPHVPDKRMLRWQTGHGQAKHDSLKISDDIKTMVYRQPSSKASHFTTVSSTSQ